MRSFCVFFFIFFQLAAIPLTENQLATIPLTEKKEGINEWIDTISKYLVEGVSLECTKFCSPSFQDFFNSLKADEIWINDENTLVKKMKNTFSAIFVFSKNQREITTNQQKREFSELIHTLWLCLHGFLGVDDFLGQEVEVQELTELNKFLFFFNQIKNIKLSSIKKFFEKNKEQYRQKEWLLKCFNIIIDNYYYYADVPSTVSHTIVNSEQNIQKKPLEKLFFTGNFYYYQNNQCCFGGVILFHNKKLRCGINCKFCVTEDLNAAIFLYHNGQIKIQLSFQIFSNIYFCCSILNKEQKILIGLCYVFGLGDFSGDLSMYYSV